MGPYLVFAASALVVIIAGTFLARFGDAIAERTGLGGLWIGAIFVALATSMPELATDISAVRQGAPDLAVGDLFGSNMANMGILATVTIVFRSRRLLQSVALENVLTATLAVSLMAIAAVFLMIPTDLGIGPVGIGPVVVFVGYGFGTFVLRGRQVEAAGTRREVSAVSRPTLSRTASGFVVSATALVAVGPFLAESSSDIAAEAGLAESFFGALFLAMVTSLPELSVSVAALRLGAFDLVVGNLLGSSATNMALLLPVDLAYTDGRLLVDANPALATSAVGAMLLITLGIAAIVLRAERRRLPVDPAAVLILVAYALVMAAVYDAG